MIHLSRLTLNPGVPKVRRNLASPYELHRTLARAFPDPDSKEHRARHGVLFRIEEAGAHGVPVLVQSATEPDWSRLQPGYALRIDGPKPFAPVLAEGQRLRFRLVANPVRRTRILRDGKPDRVRRLPLVHSRPTDNVPDGYLDWLLRQAYDHGFALSTTETSTGPEPLVEHVPFRTARRRLNGEPIPKSEVAHFGVRFDGMLTVTDAEALRRAVRDGIGAAKAFGFGLLSLAPS